MDCGGWVILIVFRVCRRVPITNFHYFAVSKFHATWQKNNNKKNQAYTGTNDGLIITGTSTMFSILKHIRPLFSQQDRTKNLPR
jgi:hypothetical protein